MWRFGELIGAPRLQNAAVKMLASDSAWQLMIDDQAKKEQFLFIELEKLKKL